MSSPNNETNRNNNTYKNKIIIKTSAPVSFLLLSFQGFMGIKFSCPCSYVWNIVLASLILIVPASFGWIMLSLFLRFEEQKNNGDGGLQTNSRGRSGREKCLYCMINCIPILLWCCIFFIDGDYLTCLMTDWNGEYTCDRNIHPNCVSWCKPESNKGGNETEKYKHTQQNNNRSKIIGYVLALVFCSLLWIIMHVGKDKESTSVRREFNRENETAMIHNDRV